MLSFNNTTKNSCSDKRLEQITEIFLKKYKLKNREVSLALVGDAVMRRLNRDYRGKDKTTDVLSFENHDNYQPELLGEIIISYPQIKRQAPQSGKSVRSELEFIFVHGLLHLAGYDDQTEVGRLEMIALGEAFLRQHKF
jgi:probable rRNA maturation factor